MVFSNSMLFALTASESCRIWHKSFIQKPKILDSIRRMTFKGRYQSILRMKNIVLHECFFRKQEEIYLLPKDKDRFVSDMMELSIMGYGILWIGSDMDDFNEIAVAKTAHNTTNIDGDVIGAFIERIEGCQEANDE